MVPNQNVISINDQTYHSTSDDEAMDETTTDTTDETAESNDQPGTGANTNQDTTTYDDIETSTTTDTTDITMAVATIAPRQPT
jgi:hypothetical protein